MVSVCVCVSMWAHVCAYEGAYMCSVWAHVCVCVMCIHTSINKCDLPQYQP